MLHSYYPPKSTKPVRRILTTSFCPLPTVKSVQTKKSSVSRSIYEAAHHLFRDYQLYTPLLIYQYQSDKMSYDVYIERLQNGWKDYILNHPTTSNTNKVIYMIDGLKDAMKEEEEIQPLLPHMAQQLDIMCRLLEI